MNIYVGNLDWGLTEDELFQVFAEYGDVSSVKIMTDRDTGRSRGFGFVEMSNDEEGRAAMEALGGNDLNGRPLRVDEARPREERSGGGNRGGGGGYGGGNRGGGGGYGGGNRGGGGGYGGGNRGGGGGYGGGNRGGDRGGYNRGGGGDRRRGGNRGGYDNYNDNNYDY